MKITRLLLLSLALAFMTLGCVADRDEPLLEKPTSNTPLPRGYIYMGETGDRVMTILDNPVNANGEAGYPGNQFTISLSENPLQELRGFCSYSTSSSYSYVASTVNGAEQGVEIASYAVRDSLMECWDVSPDSTQGSITRFNTATPHICNGQLYFVEPSQMVLVSGFSVGARVDATTQWASSTFFYQNSSSYEFNSGWAPDRFEYHVYDGLKESIEYIGFRFRVADGIRYGYARVSPGQSTLTIHQIVVER